MKFCAKLFRDGATTTTRDSSSPRAYFSLGAKSVFSTPQFSGFAGKSRARGSGPVQILIKIKNNFSSRSRKSAPSYQRRPHFASTPSAVFSNGGTASLEAEKKNSQGMRKVHSRFACFSPAPLSQECVPFWKSRVRDTCSRVSINPFNNDAPLPASRKLKLQIRCLLGFRHISNPTTDH